MDFLVCAHGNPEEEKFISYIKDYVDGVELQNYGLTGSKSIEAWNKKLSQHKSIAKKLPGRLVVHGPFFGMDYTCQDHLVREAVRKRLDMTYQMVCELKPDTLVLHARWSEELGRFSLGDNWIEENAKFWRNEVLKYTELGARIVLENVMEINPDMGIKLCDAVNHENIGLCFDIGHANLASSLTPAEWVEKMGGRLKHVHLHDNDGKRDDHLPLGKGSIDFDPFFEALYKYAPRVTVSLEVMAEPDEVVKNAVYVTEKYRRTA